MSFCNFFSFGLQPENIHEDGRSWHALQHQHGPPYCDSQSWRWTLHKIRKKMVTPTPDPCHVMAEVLYLLNGWASSIQCETLLDGCLICIHIITHLQIWLLWFLLGAANFLCCDWNMIPLHWVTHSTPSHGDDSLQKRCLVLPSHMWFCDGGSIYHNSLSSYFLKPWRSSMLYNFVNT